MCNILGRTRMVEAAVRYVGLVLLVSSAALLSGCRGEREASRSAATQENRDAFREERVVAWFRTKIPVEWMQFYYRGYGLSPFGQRTLDDWISEGRQIEGAGRVVTRLLQSGDPRVDASDLVFALKWLGTPESVPPLLKALESDNWWTSVGAAEALGSIRDKRAVEPLCKAALARDKDCNLRANAAISLGEIGDAKALRTLISVLKDDEDAFVRDSAAEALGELGDKGAVDPLSHAVLHDENARVRARAVTALGVIGDETAREALEAALNDKESSVREAAAHALQQLKQDQ